ncbi:hypothetical protein Q31b_54200 [Novipirellula aureliae]|uniref:Uncharacterized protein n=1 Tax=Novipirellula aureliae TaxID=2527966 RepID=A0A5C6DH38_9BACT|nr:hypothetical protein [Novipirellula aureliae]TWU35324.1 hypothetical protein Q31b_54200 [Novipirellula aureliae]
MASTLATRKQSAAIRDRMSEIRCDLPYDVDDARERVKQLTDWKYHFARRPLPILAAVAIAGYLIVPSRKREQSTIVLHHTGSEQVRALAKRGVMSGIVAAAGTMILRQAVSLAADHFTHKLKQGSRL